MNSPIGDTLHTPDTIRKHGDPDDRVLLNRIDELTAQVQELTALVNKHQIRLDNQSRRLHIVEEGPLFGD